MYIVFKYFILFPAKTLVDGKPEPCNGIYKVDSKVNRNGYVYIMPVTVFYLIIIIFLL